MPSTRNDWYASYGTPTEINPAFTAYAGQSVYEYGELAGELRRAFAFLRKHGDRRYSATSLMKLLTLADRYDAAGASDTHLGVDEGPRVVVAEVPFAFDEDTEVKSGGPVAIAVILPDGRMMLAVHSERRRAHLGKALYMYVTRYAHAQPVTWIHQDNVSGQQFALALGCKPWHMNSGGAIAYAKQSPAEEENDAVAYQDDEVLELQMAQAGRAPQPRNRPRFHHVDGRTRIVDATPTWDPPRAVAVSLPDDLAIRPYRFEDVLDDDEDYTCEED